MMLTFLKSINAWEVVVKKVWTIVLATIFLTLAPIAAPAQITSSNTGFPGGSTSMFGSGENSSLGSAFGNSTPTPTTPPSLGTARQGSLAGVPQAIGGTNPFQAVPPPGPTDQGFTAGTPSALGGAGQSSTIGLGSSSAPTAVGSMTGTGQTGVAAGGIAGTTSGAASSAAFGSAAAGR